MSVLCWAREEGLRWFQLRGTVQQSICSLQLDVYEGVLYPIWRESDIRCSLRIGGALVHAHILAKERVI